MRTPGYAAAGGCAIKTGSETTVSARPSGVNRQTLRNIFFNITIEQVVRAGFSSIRPTSSFLEGLQIRPAVAQQSVAALGLDPQGGPPERFGTVLREDLDRLEKVARAANIRAD